jgi:hypothetical protein
MSEIMTTNHTTDYKPSSSEIEALDQWRKTGGITIEYLHKVLSGSFSTIDVPFVHITATELPPLAREMVEDLELVAETEKGWRAIQEGRHAPLSTLKRRLDDL